MAPEFDKSNKEWGLGKVKNFLIKGKVPNIH